MCVKCENELLQFFSKTNQLISQIEICSCLVYGTVRWSCGAMNNHGIVHGCLKFKLMPTFNHFELLTSIDDAVIVHSSTGCIYEYIWKQFL